MAGLAVSAGVGAVLAYFLDPDRGRARRAQTVDRLAGLIRRTARRLGRSARYLGATAAGIGERMSHQDSGANEWRNDATLAQKVGSEVFRDPTLPKGKIDVNVEEGVVVLRGVADSDDQIERIISAVMAVDGVRQVRSLLRTAGDPSPEPSTERPTERSTERRLAAFAAASEPGATS